MKRKILSLGVDRFDGIRSDTGIYDACGSSIGRPFI